MTELQNKKEQEKVPVPVRKHEQEVKQALSEKALGPGKQQEIPRRWQTY